MGKIGIVEILVIFLIPVLLIVVISYWKIFEKAGKPGWAILVPIYSTLVQLEIVKKPWYWLLLMMIPGLGVIWQIWMLNLLVKSFGRGVGYTLGVLFMPLIFLPLLAFDKSAVYIYNQPDEMNQIGKTEY